MLFLVHSILCYFECIVFVAILNVFLPVKKKRYQRFQHLDYVLTKDVPLNKKGGSRILARALEERPSAVVPL